jgi:hypothetical protein
MCMCREDGSTALVTAVAPDTDALRTLVRRVGDNGEPVRATIESMNGARFVHDSLEFAGLGRADRGRAACPGTGAAGREDVQDRRRRPQDRPHDGSLNIHHFTGYDRRRALEGALNARRRGTQQPSS